MDVNEIRIIVFIFFIEEKCKQESTKKFQKSFVPLSGKMWVTDREAGISLIFIVT